MIRIESCLAILASVTILYGQAYAQSLPSFSEGQGSPAGGQQDRQPQERPSPSENATVPTLPASAQAAIGEVVMDERGFVDNAFFQESRICTVRGCRVYIFDKRSGALIYNNGAWSEAYGRTERGKQAIRVKAFSSEEIPSAEAPSDEGMEISPRIKSVTRYSDAADPK